jgi:hypothetical protein
MGGSYSTGTVGGYAPSSLGSSREPTLEQTPPPRGPLLDAGGPRAYLGHRGRQTLRGDAGDKRPVLCSCPYSVSGKPNPSTPLDRAGVLPFGGATRGGWRFLRENLRGWRRERGLGVELPPLAESRSLQRLRAWWITAVEGGSLERCAVKPRVIADGSALLDVRNGRSVLRLQGSWKWMRQISDPSPGTRRDGLRGGCAGSATRRDGEDRRPEKAAGRDSLGSHSVGRASEPHYSAEIPRAARRIGWEDSAARSAAVSGRGDSPFSRSMRRADAAPMSETAPPTASTYCGTTVSRASPSRTVPAMKKRTITTNQRIKILWRSGRKTM